jgi:hypothetical protein
MSNAKNLTYAGEGQPANWDNLDMGAMLPFDAEQEPQPRDRGDLFLLEAKTPAEFSAYIGAYNFGTIPPDYIVLHHTANPCTLQTFNDALSAFPPEKLGAIDAGEEGKSEPEVMEQRKQRLAGVQTFYRNGNGWNAGPHLFIDDRWIWLFSEMREPGIHAMWGNKLPTPDDSFHYGVGIEVLGYYERQRWPPAVERLVGYAVAALRKRLGTFEIHYLYPDPNSKPGVKWVKDQQGNDVPVCAHKDRLRWGGITSHRDYNKPQCPGAAIGEDYYIDVLRRGVADLEGAGTEMPVRSAPTISRERFGQVLRDANSPAQFDGDTLYDMSTARVVNPAVALAFFGKLSRFGTGYANPAKADNHNWGEIVGNAQGVGGMAAYPSWPDGLSAWLDIIDQFHGEGLSTLGQIVARYRPGGTNDPTAYARELADMIRSWQ